MDVIDCLPEDRPQFVMSGRVDRIQALARRRRIAERNVKKARLWNDESIAPSLQGVIVYYFAIGFISIVAVIIANFVGFPAKPLLGEWPTHGWYFHLPSCIMILVVPLCLRVESEWFVKITLLLVLGVTILDGYSLATNIWWLKEYITNTLTTAARAHQSVLHTGPAVVILVAVFVFHVLALTSLFHVVFLLPDLKVMFNLGTLDVNGDYVEDTE